MITRNLKVKLSIKGNEFREINKKMKSVIGKEIKDRNNGKYSIPKELFRCDKKVYDEIRYKIEIENGIVRKKKIEKYISSKVDIDDDYKSYKRIVVIIESPHKDEYDDNFNPKGPAQGKTGDMIEKNIDQILELFKGEDENVENSKYILIISNPVQFQASLGSFYDNGLHKSIRNNIWSELYKIYKDDFVKRLEEYEPNYILNATTFGRKYRINKAIRIVKSSENSKIQKVKESYHPAAWNDGEITMKKDKNK